MKKSAAPIKQAPKLLEAQNPLILRSHRLMESFGKSNDEREFYLDRQEGFIIYIDLDKSQEELEILETELATNTDRYCLIPKLTFYETKKIMEGFVNEKVYDIDTKEKLLDIIQSQEARENFLEFIYDHHSELEKWQQYYQERSRVRIIEWLRANHFHFVFEEDLDIAKGLLEKLKQNLFQNKVGKDIQAARKVLISKAKTYYSNEALNPRPKRGRPPKQIIKQEIEPQVTTDIYTTVPSSVRSFLFIPDISSASAVTFSSKFESEEDLLAHRRQTAIENTKFDLDNINLKLATLRSITTSWTEGGIEETKVSEKASKAPMKSVSKSAKAALPAKGTADKAVSKAVKKVEKAPAKAPAKITPPKNAKPVLRSLKSIKSKDGAASNKKETVKRILPKIKK